MRTYFDPEAPETVTFFTCGILSKWGFNDGDLLDWLYEHGDYDAHEVLIYIVKTVLVPKLNAQVDLVDVGSSHNPIRANSINGVKPDWYETETRFEWLRPESMEMTGAEVLAIARALQPQAEKTPMSESIDVHHEYGKLLAQDNAARIDRELVKGAIVSLMKELDDTSRMDVMSNFCHACGCILDQQPRGVCHCWNDE